MAERPILFSAPMVRALLEGRKTQTRRLLKLRSHKSFSEFGTSDTTGYDWTFRDAEKRWHDYTHDDLCVRQLQFQVRDFLWVRETWSAMMTGGWTIADARSRMFQEEIVYRADGNGYEDGDGWWPSIHMPREFSRLTLAVSQVRVQRLQDITEADAWAEGCKPGELNDRGEPFPAEEFDPHGSRGWDCARDWYADMWDSLHGEGAWDGNPWVAAYSFTVKQCNIDRVPA